MKQSPRREILKKMGVAAVAAFTPSINMIGQQVSSDQYLLKGKINHAVCSWTYSHL